MRQRVALARALAQRSDLLLMDEPFGALDAMTRDLLHDELEALWTTTDLTVLFVTHNVREAVRLGDRVILLSSRPGPDRARVHDRHPPAPPHRLARGRRPRRRDHRPPARGGAPPWQRQPLRRDRDDRRRARRPRRARARGRPRSVARVADLGRTVAEARRDRRSRCSRGSAWCGRAGSPSTCSPARPTCIPLLWQNFDTYVEATITTLQRAVRRLRHRRGDRHRARRAHRPEPHPALGGRLDDHEPHDDAVDRVVPRRDRAVRHDRGVDPVRRSSSARRRRSPTGSSPASTTPRRCSCGRRACWARRAGSRSATWCCPAALPTYVAGLKQGWAFAWRSLLAGELLVLIAGKSSLGRELDTARQFADYPGLYATMIVILIVGHRRRLRLRLRRAPDPPAVRARGRRQPLIDSEG